MIQFRSTIFPVLKDNNDTIETRKLGIDLLDKINQASVSLNNDIAALQEKFNRSPVTIVRSTTLSLTNGIAANAGSVVVPAGNWIFSASGFILCSATAIVQGLLAIADTSATFSSDFGYVNGFEATEVFTLDLGTTRLSRSTMSIPSYVVSLASDTTVYLTALAGFSSGTCTFKGQFNAIPYFGEV